MLSWTIEKNSKFYNKEYVLENPLTCKLIAKMLLNLSKGRLMSEIFVKGQCSFQF